MNAFAFALAALLVSPAAFAAEEPTAPTTETGTTVAEQAQNPDLDAEQTAAATSDTVTK